MHKKGIQIQEPSVIVVSETKNNGNNLCFFGARAKAMVGKTPGHLTALRPIRKGVIVDIDATMLMLSYLIRQITGSSRLRALKLVVGIPFNCTEVERNAVKESCKKAGAHEVYLLDEPVAAAIGAGMPIMESTANLIIDIGAGTTEIAVLSIGGVVTGVSIPVGGDAMDEAIVRMFKLNHNLIIGDNMAENIKLTIGSVYPLGEELKMEVGGRDNDTGLPKTCWVQSEEIREVLLPPAMAIVAAVKNILMDTPAELCCDLIRNGACLAGGGSLVRGFDKLLSGEVKLQVYYAEDPPTCVARGAGEYLNLLQRREKPDINQLVMDYPLG